MPSIKRAWIAVTVIAVALLALLGTMRVVADRRHDRAMTLLPSSPALERYEALIGGSASGEERQDKTDEASVSNPAEQYADLVALWESRDISSEAWDEWKRLLRNNEAVVLDPVSWEPHAEFLEAHQDLIAQIRALTASDGPLFSVDFSQGLGLDLAMEDAFNLAMLLQADALYHSAQGDYDAYASDMAAMFAFANKMGEVPVLQAQSMRLVIGLMASRAAAIGPDGGHLSLQHIHELEEAAIQAADQQPLADSVAGDALLAMNSFRTVLSDDSRSTYRTAVGLVHPIMPAEPSLVGYAGRVGYGLLYLSPFGAPLRSADEEALAGCYASLPEIAGLPYHEAEEEWDSLIEEWRDIPDTQLLTQELLPANALAYRNVMVDQARLEASVDLMRIGLELERSRGETGALPQSLDEIAGGLGGSVPLDPFTGEPYVYEASGTSFLLYSIGENRMNDGGTHDWREGDIVWRGKETVR